MGRGNKNKNKQDPSSPNDQLLKSSKISKTSKKKKVALSYKLRARDTSLSTNTGCPSGTWNGGQICDRLREFRPLWNGSHSRPPRNWDRRIRRLHAVLEGGPPGRGAGFASAAAARACPDSSVWTSGEGPGSSSQALPLEGRSQRAATRSKPPTGGQSTVSVRKRHLCGLLTRSRETAWGFFTSSHASGKL